MDQSPSDIQTICLTIGIIAFLIWIYFMAKLRG